MTAIPELVEACQRASSASEHRDAQEQAERDARALLLQAVSKGATRAQIQESCEWGRSRLEAELKKARAETDDPKLKTVRLPHRGVTVRDCWCPEKGCPRAQANGNEPFPTPQALGLHRVVVHDYRLGEKPLTAAIVRKLRAAPADVQTSDLARKYKVSYHAARSARAGKTWRSLDAKP